MGPSMSLKGGGVRLTLRVRNETEGPLRAPVWGPLRGNDAAHQIPTTMTALPRIPKRSFTRRADRRDRFGPFVVGSNDVGGVRVRSGDAVVSGVPCLLSVAS
jgi:hypothetical protein